jgi:hypothetical protein
LVFSSKKIKEIKRLFFKEEAKTFIDLVIVSADHMVGAHQPVRERLQGFHRG